MWVFFLIFRLLENEKIIGGQEVSSAQEMLNLLRPGDVKLAVTHVYQDP